jgi:hypothetical protein
MLDINILATYLDYSKVDEFKYDMDDKAEGFLL